MRIYSKGVIPKCLNGPVPVSPGFPIEAFGNDGFVKFWEERLHSNLRRVDPKRFSVCRIRRQLARAGIQEFQKLLDTPLSRA